MEDKYKLIPDVFPADTNWTAKVIVVEKSPARTAQYSPTKYQNITLMDPELEKYMDSKVDISIIGVALDIKPKRLIQTRFGTQSYIQDVVLINERVEQSVDKLDDMVLKKEYLARTPAKLSTPTRDKLTQINNIPGLLAVCDNCNKISNASSGEVYHCIYCKSTRARATPRARIFLQLEDLIGSIEGTMIGDTAEMFLKRSAKRLMKLASSASSLGAINELENVMDDGSDVGFISGCSVDSSANSYFSAPGPITGLQSPDMVKDVKSESHVTVGDEKRAKPAVDKEEVPHLLANKKKTRVIKKTLELEVH
ncbi:Uncharacterized protein Adt_17774 [Abeliophyllum distichum]|uniref:Replication factor A C-terminal domain-containing protein n=1 Tax=Abeliophyllum distichum TaxID=126358 RepID=A0ABD1THF7_9LAMI